MPSQQTSSPPLLGALTTNLSSVVLPTQLSHSAPAANTLGSPSSASERTHHGNVGEPSKNPLFGLSPSSVTADETMEVEEAHLHVVAEQQKQSEKVNLTLPDCGGRELPSLITIENTEEHPNTPISKDGKEKEEEVVANNKETRVSSHRTGDQIRSAEGFSKPSAHTVASPSPFLSSPVTRFELSDGIGPFDDSGTCQDAFVISSRKATENDLSRIRGTAEPSAPAISLPPTSTHKLHTENNHNNDMNIIVEEQRNSPPPVQQKPRGGRTDEVKEKEGASDNLSHHIICIYDKECATIDGTVNAEADGNNSNNNQNDVRETIGKGLLSQQAPDTTDEDEDEMTATPHDDHSFSRTTSGTAFDERNSSIEGSEEDTESESGSSSSGRGKRALRHNNSNNNTGNGGILNHRGSSSGWAAVKAIFGVGVSSSPFALANNDDEDNEVVQKSQIKTRKSSYDIQQQTRGTRRSTRDQQNEGEEPFSQHQQPKSKSSSKKQRRRPQRPPMRSPSSGPNLDEIGGGTANSRRRSTHFWGGRSGGAGSSISASTTGLFPSPNSRGTCAYDEEKEAELKKSKSKLRKEREEMLKRQAESQFVGFGPIAPIIAERNRYTFALLMQDKRDSVGNGVTHRHEQHGGTSSSREEGEDGDGRAGKSSLWGAFPRSHAHTQGGGGGGASGLHDPQHSSSSTSFMFATDENGRFVRTTAVGDDESTPATTAGGTLPPTVSAAAVVNPTAEGVGGAGPWLHIRVVERPFFIAALLVGGVAYGVFAIASIVATVTNYYNLNGCNNLIKVYQIAAPLFFLLTLLAYWPWCVFFAFWELPKRLVKGKALSKIATLLSSVCCLGLMGSCAVALVGIIASGGQDNAEESTCGLPYQFTRTVSISYLVFTFIVIVAYMSYYSLLVSRSASRTSGKVTKEGNPIFSSVTPLPKPKAKVPMMNENNNTSLPR